MIRDIIIYRRDILVHKGRGALIEILWLYYCQKRAVNISVYQSDYILTSIVDSSQWGRKMTGVRFFCVLQHSTSLI